MMTMRSVGFRLGTDGKAEVKNDFAEVKQAGEAAMAGVAQAAEQAAERSATATDAFTERQIAAYRKQADAAKLAAAGVASRAQVDAALATGGNDRSFATVNLDRSTGSARQSASAFGPLFEQEDAEAKRAADAERMLKQAEEERAASLAKIKALLDPLSVAQARYDAELRIYDDLLKRGDLGEAEHAAMVLRSTRALNDAKRAVDGHSNAMALNHVQMQVGTHMVRGFAEQWLYGGSVMTAASAQAGHLASFLSNDDGGVAGGLKKISGLITPTTAGVAALGAVAIAGVVAWATYAESMRKLNAAAEGTGRVLGLTGEQLDAAAVAASDAGHMTVGAARDIEGAFLGVIAPGEAAQATLAGVTALSRDFAAVTGRDAAEGAQELAAAFRDPIAGADELASKYGLLSQAQIDHIAKLVEEGNSTAAQAELLRDLQAGLKGAADRVEMLAGGWGHVKAEAAQAWEWMGKAVALAAGNQGWLGMSANPSPLGPRQADPNARTNAVLSAAMGVVHQVDGDNRGNLQRQVGVLNQGRWAALASRDFAGYAQITNTLDATQHALNTWMPAQEKATKLAQLDAQIAGTHDRALKARLGTQRAQVAAAGEVITAADAAARATAGGARAAGAATPKHDAHAKALAREAESMEVNARAALDVADAYLKSSAAGVEAEARRKAATDATRRGIDVDEQARRQLNLQVAEAVAGGAKSVAQLRDEAASRAEVLAKVSAGTLGVADMNQALSDEAALRPLLALRTVAQGAALEKLNAVIAAYRTALDDAHRSETSFGLEKALSESVERAEELRAQIKDLAHDPLTASLNAASRQAGRDANGLHLEDGSADRLKFVRARLDEAQAQYDRDRAIAADKAHKDALDQVALAGRELELLGASENVREQEINLLRLKQELAREGVSLQSAEGRQRVADLTALDQVNAKLKVAAAATDEMRQAGDQFLDDLLNPDGSGLKNLLRDVEQELLKLALINPLKNLLNGENNPTLGSVITAIGSRIGHNATGTERWSGGLTWVGENGPELINAPEGSRITPAAASRNLASNDNRPLALHIDASINAPGADPEALSRVAANQEQLQRDLPGIVLRTVTEARTRGYLRG